MNTSSTPITAAPVPARKFIVRYAGCAVKFVQNACGKQYELVPDEMATRFDSDALANQAIGKYHISGRAYVEQVADF